MESQTLQRAWVFNGAGSVIRDPNVALDTPQLTFLVCFLMRSAGQFNSGLLFNHNASLNGSSGQNAWWLLCGSGPIMDFRYRWSTNNAQFRWSLSLNKWYGLAVTYDRTLTNAPKVYLFDFATRKLIEPSLTNVAGTPSGVANTAGIGYSIGNYDGGDATFDGFIYRPRFYNWQLSKGECEREIRFPGSVTKGLILDLDDHGRDRSPKGAHASVFTSITYNGAPPGIYPVLPKRQLGFVPTVGGGGEDMSGASDGLATVAGTLTGLGALVGTSNGVAATTAALIGLGALLGTSDGVATASAVLAAIGALAGSSDGVASTTAVLTGLGALLGTSDGLATVTAFLQGLAPISGTSDGVASTTAILTALGALVGTSDGLAAVTGAMIAVGAMSGTSDGLATATALLTGLGALSGTSDGVATVTGRLFSEFIQGLAEGIATATATLTGLGALSGTSDGLAATSATLVGLAALSGLIAGVATADGTLVGLGSLVGAIEGAGSVTATLVALGALAGASSGIASVSGSLQDGVNPPRRIYTIAFNHKPFGAVIWVPKQLGNIKVTSQ